MTISMDPLRRFEWSVRALAQPAEIQLALFPSFVEVADELALDFESALLAITTANLSLRPIERERIAALDQALNAISGAHNLAFWSIESLRVAAEWRRIRELAQQLIETMAWSPDPPPTDRAIYVGSGA